MSPFKILSMFTPKKPPVCSAVIAAAGTSQRCKGADKLLYEICGKPVLAHTVQVFQNCDAVQEIVVVTKVEQLTVVSDMCRELGFTKVSKVIVGGSTRTESVLNGVFAVSDKADFIAIHDGARPFIDCGLIKNTLETAVKYHAAAPGVPVISTLKRADKSSIRNYGTGSRAVISETVDRSGLYEIQTPQVFKAVIIKAALTNAVKKQIPLTDDCMAVELIGMPVHIVEGGRRNFKITESDDLKIAEVMLSSGSLSPAYTSEKSKEDVL